MINFIIPLIIAAGVLAWVLRPGKKTTKPRRVAILVTVIPPLVVAVAAVVFQLLHNATVKVWVSDISNTCFVVGLGLVGAAILASAGSALTLKGEVAKDIGFGICIAVVVSIIELASLEWLAGV